ncbi:hypothetical protein OSC52_09530 [Clostridium pasteurianum]|uniref:hypothetical protein n=1 Tax=Clostridium pasteurianum TaxID=1501 RepID=UPI0022608D50|nr:hypothetical protein [Clostridium pasteurianum]UZW16034.1 hypothetical protein OSC52_09530 [Clostridium pasteurianum]
MAEEIATGAHFFSRVTVTWGKRMTGLKINTMVIILPIRIKCEWGECNAKEKITMVS